MKISASLYGELRKRAEGDKQYLELESGSNINGLLFALNLDVENVVITLVNGRAAGLNYELVDNDHVDIFPPLKGG